MVKTLIEPGQRKVLLGLMKDRISYITFELSLLIISQIAFLSLVVFLNNGFALIAMIIFVLLYPNKIKKYKPYYKYYNNLKDEEEFGIKPVKGKWGR